jgi:CheY-like chemotaxis protein
MGQKILTAEGLDVITVSNGEAAVKKLGEAEFDLVLADVYMPGHDGYEVCQWVKDSPKHSHIPVVLVVGALEMFEQEKVEHVHADGLLKKPFEATAMMEKVRPLIGLAAKARQARQPKPAESEVEKTVALSAPVVARAAAEVERTIALQVPVAAKPQEEVVATPPPPPEVAIPPEIADQPAFAEMSLEAPAPPEPAKMVAAPEPVQPGVDLTAVTAAYAFSIPEVAGPAAPNVEALTEEAEESPAPAPPETAPKWVAEQTEVTSADEARFPPPPAAAPETPPDWGELLRSVEGSPAASAPPPELAAIVNETAQTFAAAAAPAQAPAAPELQLEMEPAAPPAPPPPVEVAPAAPAAPAVELPSEDEVRAAVQLCLENNLPTLIDDITAAVMRRLR